MEKNQKFSLGHDELDIHNRQPSQRCPVTSRTCNLGLKRKVRTQDDGWDQDGKSRFISIYNGI